MHKGVLKSYCAVCSIHLTVQCAVYILLCSLQYTFYCAVCSIHFTVQCAVYILLCSVQYTFYCAVCSIHFTVQCAVYILLCSVQYAFYWSECSIHFTVQCAVYILQRIASMLLNRAMNNILRNKLQVAHSCTAVQCTAVQCIVYVVWIVVPAQVGGGAALRGYRAVI